MKRCLSGGELKLIVFSDSHPAKIEHDRSVTVAKGVCNLSDDPCFEAERVSERRGLEVAGRTSISGPRGKRG